VEESGGIQVEEPEGEGSGREYDPGEVSEEENGEAGKA
jgi:hypothetical protein